MRTIPLLAAALVVSGVALDAQQISEEHLKNLTFRSIGPAVMGGRIDDVAIVESNTSVIYIGSASGGVFKTTNHGTTWEAIFDDQGVGSIGDLAIAPANPELVWVGTGEPNNRQSSSFGDGVYKSIDGGKTWTHVGLRETQAIGRVVIDPRDADVVYVAAVGHLWGPNKERGLFKTADGGRTWTHALFINEDTGVTDVAIDPVNPDVLYAAAYQRRRAAWGFSGGGPHSALYKTTDGGRTWKKLTGGLPGGNVGRIGLDIYRKDPRIVYATVEHRANGGTYRSDDRGETWRRMSATNPRPMYYSQIRVDPTNDLRIYVLGSSFLVSNDGGKTFADPKTGRAGANTSMTPTYDIGVHGDHHALWIDPTDPNHLVLGGDGGLYYSFDGSISWDKVNNIPLAQFYAVAVDMQKPYNIYGGLQDTHSWGGPSATRHQIGILNGDWFQIDFGDGMYAQADPTDPNTVYIESQDGNLKRFHLATGDRKDIKPEPPPGQPPYRFNWTAPLQISPHDPKTLWLGGNRLFKSTDRGDTWTASADLTKNEDRDRLPIMGALPGAETLSRHDGVPAWGTITTLGESPAARGVVWVGTDDGNVQLSRDGGATWTNVIDRITGVPPRSLVSRVEPSPTDAATAFVALDRHRDDDFAPYIFVTADHGKTWRPIASNLPKPGWVNVVRQHPKNPALLVAGTEAGLFFSVDGGGRWVRARGGFPTVPVDDLLFHPRDNDLVVATHGRAIYVLDDVTSLGGLTREVTASDAHLFAPRPATIMQRWKHESYSAQRVFVGPNPPHGAIIDYWLRSGRAGTDGDGQAAGGAALPPGSRSDVKLTILDSSGTVVRELPGTGNAGINRIIWDLRASGPAGVEGARGPFVLPGQYIVRLSAGGKLLTEPLQVDADPALPLSDAERKARFTFLTALVRLLERAQRASAALSALNTDLGALVEQLTKMNAPAAVRKTASEARDRVSDLRRRLGGGGPGQGGGGEEGGGGGGASLRGRVSGLYGEIDGDQVRQGTLTGPTVAQQQQLEQTSKDLDALFAQVNAFVTTDLAALNDQMNKQNIPRVSAPPLIK